MRMTLLASAWLGVCLVGSACPAEEPASPPSIRIRLDRPGEQLRDLIGLFDEAKAPHPAAALAVWKRADPGRNRLSKPLGGLIAALNPRMVGELKSLEGAEVSIRFDPASGQPTWSAILPNDDGTVAALATAFVLSGGAAEAPMGDLAVDRLGPPGSAFMARDRRGTLLSKTREGLKRAGERPGQMVQNVRAEGLRVSIEPGALEGARSLTVRRLAELIRPAPGARPDVAPPISLGISLSQGTFATVVTRDGPILTRPAAIDPSWLDWIPADRALAGFALATDPAAKSWEALFGLVDRVEKLDPDRADVASARLRLDLLARAVEIRAEADLLLHLKGVSGWVGSDGKAVDGALVAFHLDDRESAGRLVAKVKPIPGAAPAPRPEAGRSRSLGVVDGREIRIDRVDRAVVLTWGEGMLGLSMQARDDPGRSAGPKLRELWLPALKTTMAGGLWPGRIPGLWPEGSPPAKALIDAPPLAWQAASDDADLSMLLLNWPGLEATVKRFLDLIPLDPPPDH